MSSLAHGRDARSLELVGAVPEPLLQPDDVAVDEEARAVERGLGVETVVHEARDELHVRLGLDVAAHHAERATQAAVAEQHARDDRVVWAADPAPRWPLIAKQAPRFWRTTPVPGATMPEPKPPNRLWMNETAVRSPSTAQR